MDDDTNKPAEGTPETTPTPEMPASEPQAPATEESAPQEGGSM